MGYIRVKYNPLILAIYQVSTGQASTWESWWFHSPKSCLLRNYAYSEVGWLVRVHGIVLTANVLGTRGIHGVPKWFG